MNSTEHLTSTPITPDLLRGAVDHERTALGLVVHRLPQWARAQCIDPQLAMSESQPSGVRIAFRTRATVIELEARPTKRVYVGLPPRPDGVFDLVVDGEPAGQAVTTGGNRVIIDMAAGSVDNESGPTGTARFDGLADRAKNVEIWLPHNENVELVALRSDASIEPSEAAARPTWLHYGSSISQGSNATSPTTIWPAIAASRSGVELTNFGFGGSALLDPFVARVIRDLPADRISLKIGINLVNSDVMRMRAFTSAVHGFVDTIRDGHPTTPLLIVSPIYCPIHEDTPGPGAFDPVAIAEGNVQFIATGDPLEVASGKLTLTTIRAELARIVAQRAGEDPNLHYLDGRELYGESDFAELPLIDRLHPDTAAHQRIAERFVVRAFTGRDGARPIAASRVRGDLRGTDRN